MAKIIVHNPPVAEDIPSKVVDEEVEWIESIVGANARPTMRLRIRAVGTGTEPMAGRVQQLWQGAGGFAWIDLPVVWDDDPAK